MARATLAGLLVCVLALAGCASLADLGQLREDLDAAGYDATSLNHNTTNGVAVMSVDVSMTEEPTDADAERVAEIVWTKYPGEIDRLQIAMNGRLQLEMTDDDLRTMFGDRPEGKADEESGGSSALTVVLILVGAAVFAGLMVFLWYRGRKPPPPVAPPPAYPHQQFHYPPQPPQG